MATRTVRLDDDAERILAAAREATGLSVSAVLKLGLVAVQAAGQAAASASPFEVYAALDLGPGGYARAPAREAKAAVRRLLLARHRRRP